MKKGILINKQRLYSQQLRSQSFRSTVLGKFPSAPEAPATSELFDSLRESIIKKERCTNNSLCSMVIRKKWGPFHFKNSGELLIAWIAL